MQKLDIRTQSDPKRFVGKFSKMDDILSAIEFLIFKKRHLKFLITASFVY